MGKSNLREVYERLLIENKDRLVKDVQTFVDKELNPVSTNAETVIQDSMYASFELSSFALNQRIDLLIAALDEVMNKSSNN